MAKINFAQKLKDFFGLHNQQNPDFFEDLQDMLIEGDLGTKTAYELVAQLEKNCKEKRLNDSACIIAELKKLMLGFVKGINLLPEPNKTNIFLTLGVNGVGKTTSVAKMAKYYTAYEKNICIAAADTFRAAAIDQLKVHSERLGIRLIAHQHGSDPSAVVFDAATAISAQGGGLVLVDTAGRLHNKDNLVRELQKIDRIALSKADAGCYKKILVLDCTTGQNALRQAEVFHEAVKIDGVILTKYDSSAKGGAAASIGKELALPIAFVGTGEGYADFSAFSEESYINDFLGIKT